jgi:hypothetical protein
MEAKLEKKDRVTRLAFDWAIILGFGLVTG